MKVRKLLTATGTCAIMLLPAIGSAQDNGGFMMEEGPVKKAAPIYDNQIEAGVRYNSEDSFKFGEYTGLNESKAYPILNFDLMHRDGAWDSGDTGYYRIQGKELGMDSRRFKAEYGNQGHYSVGLAYREIPHNLIKDARTPYRGVGSNVLTLPSNWVAAPTTNGFATLGQSLQNVDIETKRKKVTGMFSYLPSNRWQFDVDVTHKERDGTKPIFAAFATNGGNPSAVELARPDEFSVNEIKAKADYAARDMQMEFKYKGSFFNDKNNVLLFQNPYSMQASGGPWAPGTGYPSSGGYSLPPDNESHQFTFSGGYALSETSRLSAQLSYSMLRQDQQFLPYSTNPLLRIRQPLPRQSLDGKVDIFVGDLAYTALLAPRTNLRAHLRYENEDNKTPRDVYFRLVGDAQNQPTGLAQANANLNLPYSFKNTHFDTEIEHRLSTRTQVGAEYKFDQKSRTFSEVDKTNEHTIGANMRHRFSNSVRSRFIYRFATRNGNDSYTGNAPYLAGHTIEFLNTVAPDEQFQNHPAIRKFNQADRRLNQLKAIFNISATPMTTWSVSGQWQKEDYHDTSLGLTDREQWRASVDWNRTMSEQVMLHGFYAYEEFDDTINGHQFRPGQSLTNPAQDWTRDAKDRVHSLGAGFTWAASDKLDIDVNYTAELARTNYNFSAGAAEQPVTDAPTLKSTLHSVDVTADWKMREDRRLRFGYTYEYFDSTDFAVDNIGVNSVSRILTFGNGAPHYSANVIGVSYVANW